MPLLDPAAALSTRQEAFCRHYAASGNAADAARRAGYAVRSARQTGCALLERPWIVERLRRIRLSWRRTERDEAQIALARLEQAWDAAAAAGSAWLMLQVVRLQAEIAGLTGRAALRRAALWPLPGEDEFGELAAGEAQQAGTEPGPLAEAVRRGHARAGRALARHGESRQAQEAQQGFDEAARRLAEAVEERERLPVRFEAPEPPPPEGRPPADDPPEDTYDPAQFPGEWPDGARPSDEERAEGAETDWLYQRRNGYTEIHDPWAPEAIEQRRQDSRAWLAATGPETRRPPPEHDKT